jgi:hypothetical protein
MRRTALILTFLLPLLSLTAAQKTNVKQVRVTSQAVASQSTGKQYTLDLVRGGTVYHIDEDVDLGRVQVRTPSGLIAMAELVKQTGRSGKLLVGHTRDVLSQDLHLSSAARQTGYSCGQLLCRCTGFGDCLRMGQDGVCKGISVCNDTGCTCLRGFSRNVSSGSRLSQ